MNFQTEEEEYLFYKHYKATDGRQGEISPQDESVCELNRKSIGKKHYIPLACCETGIDCG